MESLFNIDTDQNVVQLLSFLEYKPQSRHGNILLFCLVRTAAYTINTINRIPIAKTIKSISNIWRIKKL